MSYLLSQHLSISGSCAVITVRKGKSEIFRLSCTFTKIHLHISLVVKYTENVCHLLNLAHSSTQFRLDTICRPISLNKFDCEGNFTVRNSLSSGIWTPL